jgi:cytochrome o ubiquinol oxidase operon protein cyoD
MDDERSLEEVQKEWHGSTKAYVSGFILCLLLSIASFSLVVFKPFGENYLPHILIGLALVQAAFQMIFFLHIGQEAKPRWETIAFAFTILVLLIIMIGSLWIMHDLNERVMAGM